MERDLEKAYRVKALSDIFSLFVVSIYSDRCRTATNILGDAFGSGIVAHLSRDEIDYHFGKGDENAKSLDPENNSLFIDNEDTKV